MGETLWVVLAGAASDCTNLRVVPSDDAKKCERLGEGEGDPQVSDRTIVTPFFPAP